MSEQEIEVKVKIVEDEQIKAALEANAAAFQARGGSHLMLTEAVENGNDAIEDNRMRFGFAGRGIIRIKVDTRERRVIVTDNGTGIMRPIYILENPFKSLKRNISYNPNVKGQFGRGLQGFRGFCEELTYFSKRKDVAEEERQGHNTNCKVVRLRFFNGSIVGKYAQVDESEFRKYCEFETGTVAIYKKWLEGEFEGISERIQELYDRIQHHFGELVRKGTVTVTFQVDDQKPMEVKPRDFDAAELFPIAPIEVKDRMGNVLGNIEFYLYKAPRLKHRYKKAYLLVQDRPLQNSFISEFPEFDNQDVWKSNYVTGYVKCDFVKPNQLRVGLEAGEHKALFVSFIRSTSVELKRMIREFTRSLENAELEENIKNIVMEVQSFLKRQEGFNFKKLIKRGMLDKNDTSDQVGIKSGSEERAPMANEGPEEDVIFVGKPNFDSLKKYGHTGKHPWKHRHKGRSFDLAKDGPYEVSVQIDPQLQKHLSGRRRKHRPVGPGMTGHFIELDDHLSRWDEDSKSVILNTAHDRFKSLYKSSKQGQAEHNSFKRKLDNLIAQQYLWHIVRRFAQIAMEKDAVIEDVDAVFWDLNYKYFEARRA